MLCEMIQSQKKYYTISLFEVFSQTHKAENKMVVVLPGMGGGVNKELLFNGYRILVLHDEKKSIHG